MAFDSGETPNPSILKFESMLKTDAVYFFDAEDFEDIIHHYLNHGKISLAKKAIRMGMQQHPDALQLHLLHVEVLVFENQLGKAEAILDELQEIDGRNEEILIQRANIQSKKDNHQGAIDFLKKALELVEDDFDIYSLMGMEYLFLDNYAEAKGCFLKCLAHDPEDYASLYNVVYCYEFLDDPEGAIRFLNAYLDRNPYCQVAWHQLGKQYYTLEMYPEALSSFDFAIIADESFIGAYFEKGKVLEMMGRYQEAIANYNITIELDDPTSHAYLHIGRCFERLGQDQQARHYYYLTVHEDPLLDKGWLAITDFYLRQRQYRKALEYIDKAINIDGENAQYWKRCGLIHQALCELDQADYAYKRAVELGHAELDIWMRWASVLRDSGEYGAAAEVLLQGAEQYPEAAEINYQLAGICHKLGKPSLAAQHLKAAFKRAPSKLKSFKKAYPEFYGASWVQGILRDVRKASE